MIHIASQPWEGAIHQSERELLLLKQLLGLTAWLQNLDYSLPLQAWSKDSEARKKN